MAARQAHNLKVAGSSPAPATNSSVRERKVAKRSGKGKFGVSPGARNSNPSFPISLRAPVLRGAAMNVSPRHFGRLHSTLLTR